MARVQRQVSWDKKYDELLKVYTTAMGISVSELLRRLIDEFFARGATNADKHKQ